MSIKFDDEIIFDDEAILEVFINAKVHLEQRSEKLEMETALGYCFKDGKILEGAAYENEIKYMKIEMEILTELFSGEKCRQYRIEEEESEESEEYEIEI